MMGKVDADITITIDIKPSEARALYDELHTWVPSGGWSRNAEDLFRLLKQAGGLRDDSE